MAPHQSKQPDEPVIRRSRTLDGHCQGLLPGMVCIFRSDAVRVQHEYAQTELGGPSPAFVFALEL